jgi:glutaredoxin
MDANYFHVFAKKRCKHCKGAIDLLKDKSLDHVITYCDSAPTALKNLKSHCQWQTVPIIFEVAGENENFIGGFTELKEHFNGEEES